MEQRASEVSGCVFWLLTGTSTRMNMQTISYMTTFESSPYHDIYLDDVPMPMRIAL